MPRASPPKRRRSPASTGSRLRAVRAGRAVASARTMKACRGIIDLLTEYLEGGLSSDEAARLESHLRGCDGCAEFVQSLRTVRAAARTPVADAVPDACRRALRSFLRQRLKRSSR